MKKTQAHTASVCACFLFGSAMNIINPTGRLAKLSEMGEVVAFWQVGVLPM